MRVWNTCRGIDWHALDLMAELHGITDIDTLVAELTAIRDFMEANHG